MALFRKVKAIAAGVSLVALLVPPALKAIGNGQVYADRSKDEVELISMIVASEIKANKWANSELVCLSVNGLDPSAAMVKSLRQRYSGVRSSAEWAKKFNCSFELQIEYPQSGLSGNVKVLVRVIDLRGINRGESDLAILLREGEYSLQKVGGKWSIKDYSAESLTRHTSSRF